jgi:peroxiredoxin
VKLHEGNITPELTAMNIEGKEVSLSGLCQNGPVVLVFLRGFS